MACTVESGLSELSFQRAEFIPARENCDAKLFDNGIDPQCFGRGGGAEPSGVWNGLALSFSLAAILNHDANGNTIGVNGSYAGPLNILQNFWESVLQNPLDSSTVEVS